MFGDENLALVRHDCRKLWKKSARKCIRSDDDPTSDDCSSVGYYAVLAVIVRDDVSYLRLRIQSDAGTQCTLYLTAYELKRMVCAISGYEAAEKRRVDPEFFTNLRTRPYLNTLAMLGGQRHLIANCLLLFSICCAVEPSLRRKIAGNSFVQNGLFKQVAIAQRQSKHKRCLPFTHGSKHDLGHLRIAPFHVGEAARSEPFVNANRVFRDQFEIAAISAARFSCRIALVE